MNNNLFLIEDHDEALKIWRKKKIPGLDLVHIDAHIDFGFHPAQRIDKVFKSARTFKQLRSNLEYTLNYAHYERDFAKQTNIGNYIYPAMEEGIVRDFYWVIPGRMPEFKKAARVIKNIVKGLLRQDRHNFRSASEAARIKFKKGIVSVNLFGRRFTICILEKLPLLKQRILLDIDTDFLVIDSLLNADNTKYIGKRKPWISSEDLCAALKKKIKRPQVITVAYSVNGGYTPMKYKHLGDEAAYSFAPEDYKRKFKINSRAARYYNLFSSTNKKEYYQKAIRLNPSYRAADNNYGPLYLSLREFSKARAEFLKVLRADPENPYSALGLGNIALQKKDFKRAKEYFSKIRTKTSFCNGKILSQRLLGLAQAEFGSKNFKEAKKLLLRYKILEPLSPHTYYLLARIFEKEKKYPRATRFYQDAIRLGSGDIGTLSRLLKVSLYLKEKDNIIGYVTARFRALKSGFVKAKRLALNKKKKIAKMRKIENKLEILEKRLYKIKKEGD